MKTFTSPGARRHQKENTVSKVYQYIIVNDEPLRLPKKVLSGAALSRFAEQRLRHLEVWFDQETHKFHRIVTSHISFDAVGCWIASADQEVMVHKWNLYHETRSDTPDLATVREAKQQIERDSWEVSDDIRGKIIDDVIGERRLKYAK
ncbi:hypothetical protein [Bradyrhizobium japonicum]|uniref:hypothetical protein n=1 Tax=Bradyrhizobium japonicum TaxID=375 RepID=UPI001E4450A0|nr:hypothetical protein [Bradyrhizobium japonicum]MCD9821178.1 hypothetical protein [Bradyrhizobium japonicum]MEB2674125.1 hypothetical protein [Bradyrhizobium japonicum]WRI93312.1 hypothetical protein R3F75_21205 [Bradyrhizobium japonicum]